MGKKAGDKAAILILWILYLFVVIALVYLTKTGIDKVFVGTAPLFFYIIVFMSLYFHRHMKGFHVWIAPLIFPLVFFGLWYSELIAALNSMDGLQLTIFNIIASYLINILFLVLHVDEKLQHKKTRQHHGHYAHHQSHVHPREHHQHLQREYHKQRKEHAKQHAHHQAAQQKMQQHHARQLHHYHRQNQQYAHEINRLKRQVQELERKPQITQENFRLNLKSIEDKCKAINFVIGRVYSDKKGGNPELRGKINIPREMYNLFSEMAAEFKQEHMGHLLQVLTEINDRLVQLEKAENQVVSVQKNPHIVIDRNPNGTDRIIDVLSRNDQDPIGEYHSEAKEICKSLLQFIRQNYR